MARKRRFGVKPPTPPTTSEESESVHTDPADYQSSGEEYLPPKSRDRSFSSERGRSPGPRVASKCFSRKGPPLRPSCRFRKGPQSRPSRLFRKEPQSQPSSVSPLHTLSTGFGEGGATGTISVKGTFYPTRHQAPLLRPSI